MKTVPSCEILALLSPVHWNALFAWKYPAEKSRLWPGSSLQPEHPILSVLGWCLSLRGPAATETHRGNSRRARCLCDPICSLTCLVSAGGWLGEALTVAGLYPATLPPARRDVSGCQVVAGGNLLCCVPPEWGSSQAPVCLA